MSATVGPKPYEYVPQADITVQELALLLPVVIGQMTARDRVVRLDTLDVAALGPAARHFRYIASDDEAEWRPADFYANWPKPVADALRRERVSSWRDLANLTRQVLLRHSGVGAKHLNFIVSQLARQGLALSDRATLKSARAGFGSGLPEATMCGVYLVRSAECLKIGMARHIERRIKTARTFAASPIALIDVIPCSDSTEARTLERRLHEALSEYRQSGEWFIDCEAVLTAFAEAKHDRAKPSE